MQALSHKWTRVQPMAESAKRLSSIVPDNESTIVSSTDTRGRAV